MSGISSSKRNMIDLLVANAVSSVSDDPDGTWLRLILRRGFNGFENMTEVQLRTELQMRGLAGYESQDAEEVDAEDDEDAGVEWRMDFGPTMAVASDLDAY